MLSRRGVAAFAALSLYAAAPAAASPADLFGFGGRSPGMGGTGVATATDFDAAYLNPAGLADVVRKRITFGFLFGDFDLELDGRSAGTDSATGLLFGGAVPVPLGGALQNRLGFGIGFLVPPNAINRAQHPFPGEPVFELLETRAHVVGLQLGLGARISKRWRAGLGVMTLATLDGRIHVSTDAAGRFTTRSQQDLVTRLTPVAGVRFLVPELHLQTGLVFRGAAQTDYQILITNDLQESLPLTIPTLTIGGTSQYDPMTVAFEAAYERKRRLVITLQVAWARWSAYPLPTVNPVEAQPPQQPPGFRNTFIPRLGVQRVLWHGRRSAGVVRAGYQFVPSPAPEMTGKQSLLDNTRHVLSGGAGLYLPGMKVPLYLDGWVQLHQLVGRSHEKDPALFEPGEEMPFDRIDTGGRIFVGGMTVGVDI
jgi:long-chain fatty acid transport protein